MTGDPVASYALAQELHTVTVVHGFVSHMFVLILKQESTGLVILVIRAAGMREHLTVVTPSDRGERHLPTGLGSYRG
jgi:hypothetical protein